MGKTIKKNQTPKRARGVAGGTYVVGGQRYVMENISSQAIADELADRGRVSGTKVRWNGGEYKLERGHFGENSLVRVA